jgi:methionyl-tRNA formyltransferase
MLINSLPLYLNGSLVPQAQDGSFATYAPMIKKDDGLLDLSLPAIDLERRIRAYNPWPGAFIYWKGQVLKIHQAHVVEDLFEDAGRKVIHQGFPAFITGKGILLIDLLQPAGKKVLTSKAFLLGARNWTD